MQHGLEHALFHHIGADRGYALVVKGAGIGLKQGIVHHIHAVGGDDLSHLVSQQRQTLLGGFAGEQGEEAPQQRGSCVLFQYHGIEARRNGGCTELACSIFCCLFSTGFQIKDLHARAEGQTVLHLIPFLQHRLGVAQGDGGIPAGLQATGVGNMDLALFKRHLIAGDTGAARIGSQCQLFQLHSKVDALGIGQLCQRIFRQGDSRIVGSALHGMYISAFRSTGVVHGPGNQRLGLFQQLGIGIAVLAVQADANRQAQCAADRIAVDLLLHDLYRKIGAFLCKHFGVAAALFQSDAQQRVTIGIECHKAPPLPPTMMEETRIRG